MIRRSIVKQEIPNEEVGKVGRLPKGEMQNDGNKTKGVSGSLLRLGKVKLEIT